MATTIPQENTAAIAANTEAISDLAAALAAEIENRRQIVDRAGAAATEAVGDALAQKRGLGDLAVYAPTFSGWTFTPLVEGGYLDTGPDWIATEEDFNESAYFGAGLWDGAGWYAIYGIEGSGSGVVHPSGGENATELLISSDGKLTRTVTGWAPVSPADAIAKVSQLPTVPSAYASTPAMDGAGSAGSSTAWAKGDHVHPTDTSRAAKTELPYPFVTAMVTQDGPWAFSEDGDYSVSETEYDGTWSYVLSENGAPVDSHSFAARQTSVEFSFIPSGEAVAVTITATRSNVLTITPRTVTTYTADSSAAAFTVAVGTGTTGAARDCELVIDCTATGAVAPTVTWPANFHPRTDAEEIAPVAGVRNVFYISEYAAGEFVVGGWHEEVA